jgi:hypothetical protein
MTDQKPPNFDAQHVLGEELCSLLGHADLPALSLEFDATTLARLGENEGRERLGEALWEAMTALPEPEWPAHLAAESPLDWMAPEGVAVLGDALWDVLDDRAVPSLSPQFDERIQARLHAPDGELVPLFQRGVVRRLFLVTLLAAAAGTMLVLQVQPLPSPTQIDDDLALLGDLELMEQLDLVSHPEFELLLKWDGRVP